MISQDVGSKIEEDVVPSSVIEAIQQGIWDFEPDEADGKKFKRTGALPGTGEKLGVLAERLSKGLPLWHPEDRRTFRDDDVD